jgi:hypothetical protein
MTPPESDLRGVLTPGNIPIPTQYLFKPFEVGPDHKKVDVEAQYKGKFRVYLGGDACVFTTFGEVTVLRLNGQDLVKIRRTPEGVSLSATVYREDGRWIAKIEDNEYKVNPNNYFQSPIRQDKSTIAVRDQTGTEVLRASFLNETAFEILGVFMVPGSPPLQVTRDKIISGTKHIQSNSSIDPTKNHACFSFLHENGDYTVEM